MAQDFSSHTAHAHGLNRFIDASPSPFHVVETATQMLDAAGFQPVRPGTATSGGRFYSASGGALVAWVVPNSVGTSLPFRIVGAHTDSPNLRLKPNPEADAYGYRRLGVEVYGGVLLNSWLDRDLGLSGRIAVRGSNGPEQLLVKIDQPMLRVPQLAIHLDREISDKGLLLNRQHHLGPIFGLGGPDAAGIWDVVSDSTGVASADIVGADLMLHDTQGSQLIGLDQEFISAPRLDNQLSCHAALTAIAGISSSDAIAMVAMFDHEEVGSVSATGAASAYLGRLLSAITEGLGGSASDHAVALSESMFISADNAHATHPNYPERHEPAHHIALNAGPVLKHNANQRYTTNAMTEGMFRLAAERAGVSTQAFVNRTDMGCGSTIGPTVSALLGVQSLDIGCPQLAMHSCRELAGTYDPWDMTLLIAELLR